MPATPLGVWQWQALRGQGLVFDLGSACDGGHRLTCRAEHDLYFGLREAQAGEPSAEVPFRLSHQRIGLGRRSHMVNATTPLVSQMVSSSQEFVEAGH